MQTPFLPALRAVLAPMGSRTTKARQDLRACTLCQLESRFTPLLRPSLFPKAAAKQNSRDRIYTPWRTFWCFLWQSLNPRASCREVVRQLQALFELHGVGAISPDDAAYCRARQRLPADPLVQALSATARASDQAAPRLGFLQGRPVKVVDGSTVTLPDTAQNQKAYPQVSTLKESCGFPMMRLVVLFSLLSGAVLAMLPGSMYVGELRLFHQLMPLLAAGDIVVGDAGFGNFVALALLQGIQVDFLGRSVRQVDGRRHQRRLGPNDWLVRWQRSVKPSAILTPPQWAALPTELTVRIVRGSLYQPGFRVRQVTLVTTLLDAKLYPAQDLLRAYLRRWRLEMCLDDLKTTLGMETLRCQSPAMARKEACLYLIAHNLIRYTMAQAAAEHAVPIERLSFKGSLDALRQFSQALSQAATNRKRRQLWAGLLRTLAADLVPDRPGRREPRAVKRKSTKYPRLNAPRNQFRDPPKRNERRRNARLRGFVAK